MKIGDLVRVRHHHQRHEGNLAVVTEKRERAGFCDMFVVHFVENPGSWILVTPVQGEVVNEGR